MSVTYNTTPEGLAQAITKSWAVAIDLETTGLSPFDSKIRLLSVRPNYPGNGVKCWVIDLFKHTLPPSVIEALSHAVLYGHNIKFDLKFLRHHYGLKLKTTPFDTFRASYMLHNGKEDVKHDLYSVRERLLGIPPGEDLAASDWSAPELSRAQLDYAAGDVEHLHAIVDALGKQLRKANLHPAIDYEMEAIVPEVELELNGFYLDKSKWSALEEVHIATEKELREQLWKELPSSQIMLPGISGGVDLYSTKEVQKSFKRLGIEVEDTNKVTLAQIAGNYPVLQKFMKWRKSAKAISSFGSEFLTNINPSTGRIHPSYWPLTGAGRYSCSGPNLQQIPGDKRYRACFTAPEGKKLVIADYSQIELRILAAITGDRGLCGIFRNDEDAHTRTASIISDVSPGSVTSEQRSLAKPVNFGLMYGMGPKSLALYSMVNYGIPMTEEQAEVFHQRYFQAYKGVGAWHKKALQEGRRTGMSRTLDGRLRFLNPEECYSEFFNTPVQGTGAGGMKHAMAMLQHRLPDSCKVVNIVHDEIVVECPEEEAEDVACFLETSMVEAMQDILQKTVPVVVEASIGDSWADK